MDFHQISGYRVTSALTQVGARLVEGKGAMAIGTNTAGFALRPITLYQTSLTIKENPS